MSVSVSSGAGQFQTLFCTDLQKIMYPVQGRGGKNPTLFSGISRYRPYWLVPPPGI